MSGNILDFNSQVPFLQMVAQGGIAGYAYGTKLGFNPTITSSADVLISTSGSLLPYMPTAAVTIEALSTAATDTSTGVGVRQILVTGLDTNFNEIQEVITLNGVTPVVSAQSFIRVYSAISIACGTYRGSNSGGITVRASGGGTTFMLIVAGEGTALTTHFCVPAGKTLYLYWFFAAIEGAKNVSLTFWTAPSANVTTPPYAPLLASGKSGGISAIFETNFNGVVATIPSLTDVWVSGQAAAGISAAATAQYTYILK